MPRAIGLGVDIGAVEDQSLFVATEQDTLHERSLRKAIIDANAVPGFNEITLPAGTFQLTLAGEGEEASLTGDLDITDDLKIVGSGPGRTFIDASELGDRAFDVFESVGFTLSDLTLIGGKTSGTGGAIRNHGNLTLNEVHVLRSQAEDGGALHNASDAQAEITHSSFTQNQASNDGGAIFNQGDLNLANATLANNSAAQGGGFSSAGMSNTSLNSVTVAENSASSQAGGVFSELSSTIEISNTLVANNSAPSGPDMAGTFNSQGHNLIGTSAGAGGFLDTDLLDTNAQLMSLNSTESLPYFGLLHTSPAIDAAFGSVEQDATDQIGTPRLLGSSVDIGAVEQSLLKVTSTADSLAAGTLRTAVLHANQLSGKNQVSFDSAIDGEPILLTQGEIIVSDSLEVAGNGPQQ